VKGSPVLSFTSSSLPILLSDLSGRARGKFCGRLDQPHHRVPPIRYPRFMAEGKIVRQRYCCQSRPPHLPTCKPPRDFNADWLIVCSTRDKESYDDRLRIMKKLFAALTVLGIVLGTAILATTPANAAILSFGYQGDNQGAGS